MPFSLVKAIKSTHRHPANRILHLIGLPIYVTGITLIAGYFLNLNTKPITGLILWLAAVCLFLIGHKIEGNLKAMTLIVLFKYLSRKAKLIQYRTWRSTMNEETHKVLKKLERMAEKESLPSIGPVKGKIIADI